MATKTVVLPRDLRNRFKDFITGRSGLYFRDHDLRNLEDAISARMKSRGLTSPASYFVYLTTSEDKENEFRELLNLLTIPHTYFFRNEPHFKALRERILPEIIARKTQNSRLNGEEKPILRIWSAGCATGEEPYSIAMTILDVIPNPEGWDIQIIATDASTLALDRARKGIYSGNSTKLVDEEHLERYFTEQKKSERSQQYEINDKIKKMVTFGFHNLITDEFPANFDIIFCRNVVIYFELETTIKIMNRFCSSLNDNGYIFIGYSEALNFISDNFKMKSWEDAIYYRKVTKVAVPEAVPAAPKEEFDVDEVLEEISRAELVAEMEAKQKAAPPPPKKMKDVLIKAMKHLHLKEYDKALELAEEAIRLEENAVDPYYIAAEIYVNQGKFGEAKERLRNVLRLNSIFAPAHYLMGCIYIEEGALEEAKESLRKSLYIDKDFSLAHFYLAYVHKNEGKHTVAIKEYRNTLKVLSKSPPEGILAYSGGFNTATLMSVCRDNIERLKVDS